MPSQPKTILKNPNFLLCQLNYFVPGVCSGAVLQHRCWNKTKSNWNIDFSDKSGGLRGAQNSRYFQISFLEVTASPSEFLWDFLVRFLFFFCIFFLPKIKWILELKIQCFRINLDFFLQKSLAALSLIFLLEY